jgi:hypothetical protein
MPAARMITATSQMRKRIINEPGLSDRVNSNKVSMFIRLYIHITLNCGIINSNLRVFFRLLRNSIGGAVVGSGGSRCYNTNALCTPGWRNGRRAGLKNL